MAKRDDFETPPGVPYEGPSGLARDSVWLTQEDVPHDKETVLLIEAVTRRDNVKFQGGRAKAIMLALRFAGFKRELGLNATNRKTLNALFGPLCKNWVGKRVALFVQQDVSTPDGPKPAVRIRARHIEGPSKSAQPTPNTATDPIDQDFDRAAAARDNKR